jgi:hypothetical protein
MSRFHQIHDEFYPRAAELRAVFDERFADVRSTRADRFVWDYWHVPDQYTFLRTPAWEYFPEDLYRDFHESIVLWGRRTLGCWDVSPPWLSCYVEGCEQQLHSDVPHGPWAWVFSLSPESPRYRGGETQLIRNETLDYWPRYSDAEDRELESFVKRIPSPYNRLTVFDPRIPHGVTPLTGTRDPREGRLVIHGWFTEPRVFVEGALSDEEINARVEPALGELPARLGDLSPLGGMLSLRASISAEGRVEEVEVLANTLVRLEAVDEGEDEATQLSCDLLAEVVFPVADGPTQLTLPLLFR